MSWHIAARIPMILLAAMLAPPPLPLYYFGHALPAPSVKIILEYGYEMTVWEDMVTLHDKLDDMLSFLRHFKDAQKEHLWAYEILGRQISVADRISNDSTRLCHFATVNLGPPCAPSRGGDAPYSRSTGPRWNRAHNRWASRCPTTCE